MASMFKKIICIFAIFSLFIFSNVFAATKEDVIRAINKTYTVADETYRLPQNIINKGENYLNKNPLTSAQYDNILKCIDNAVALAREVGTTDISKVSREDLQRALRILIEASESANVDLDKYIDAEDILAGGKDETPEKLPSDDKDAITNKPENNLSNNDPNKNPVDNKVDNNFNNDSNNNNSNKNNNDIENKVDENIQNPNINASGNIIDDPSTENPMQPGVTGGETYSSGEGGTATNKPVKDNNKGNSIDDIINRNINLALAGIILILLVLFLIFYLILRAKWNRILRYVLMIIFVILIIISLVVLVGAISYMEEIKLIYKLYYMFK